MSKLCSRCLQPTVARQRRHRPILCDPCRLVWERERNARRKARKAGGTG